MRRGERVEQRALPGIRVTDDTDREMLASSLGDDSAFAIVNLVNVGTQVRDAFTHEPAIRFQLRFTRPARADAHAAAGAAGDAF